MDYQFTLKRRTFAVVVFLLALLFVLFFLLGLQLGRDWNDKERKNNQESAVPMIKPLGDLDAVQAKPIKPASN